MNELITSCKENTSEYFGGAAFITFNTIKEQEKYLSQFPNHFFGYILNFFKNLFYFFKNCYTKKYSIDYYKRFIKVEKAPEPDDMIFENIQTGKFRRIIYIILVYFICLIICFLNLIIVWVLCYAQLAFDYFKGETGQTKHKIFFYLMSFIITGVTIGVDILLEKVLEYLTKLEKQTTWTKFYLSYSIKLTIFSFLNSSFIQLWCYVIMLDEIGIINNLFIKFLVNSFVTPLMWTINVGYICTKFKKCLILKGKITYNQKDLNELYELQSMNVSAKYSYIAKTVLLSFFYIQIFPFGLIITSFGFIFAYWIEKYNFAKIYKKPKKLDKLIAEFYTNYLVVALFIYQIGDFLFIYYFYSYHYQRYTWKLVKIIVFSLFIFLPYHKILSIDFLKIKGSKINTKTYDEKYIEFNTDYERVNPMTKKEGKLRYLNKLEEKNIINKEEKNKRKEEIQNENPFRFYQEQTKVKQYKNIKGLKNSSIKNKKKNKKFIISTINDNYNCETKQIIKKRKTRHARTKINKDFKSSTQSNNTLNRNTSNIISSINI